MKSYMRYRPSQFAYMIIFVIDEVHAKMPLKTNFESKNIPILLENLIPSQTGIWKCWFLRSEKNQIKQSKTSWSKGETQKHTQPTYGVDARI